MARIEIATSDEDILACFPVLAELRPHLTLTTFVESVRRVELLGYRLVLSEDGGKIVAVAGCRVSESLAWGKFLYVDDLVVREALHQRGHGKQLFLWLKEYARDNGCRQIHLDSGVQRFRAHRFYLGMGMEIRSHHFALKMK